MSKPSVVFGWQSPALAMYLVGMEMFRRGKIDQATIAKAVLGQTDRPAFWRIAFRIVFFGILLWLWWLLPNYREDGENEFYRFLAFHVNIIRGPYSCSYCGRATTQGPDLQHSLPAYCARQACMNKASEVFST